MDPSALTRTALGLCAKCGAPALPNSECCFEHASEEDRADAAYDAREAWDPAQDRWAEV